MKARYFILIALGLVGSNSFSQSKSSTPSISQMVALSWEINIPSGNDGVITETSLSGGRFEYRKFFTNELSAGFGISLSSVEQYFGTHTYEKPDGSMAVTTDMIRQALVLPMTITGHYYPSLGFKMLKPYIGIGLGAQYASQDIFYNIYVINNDDWGFVARPEVGTLILFSENIGALASAAYNYSTNKVDALGISSMKQISFNIGLVFNVD